MMKTLKNIGLAVALAVGLGVGVAASAQTVGYNIRTGDVWVDSRLGEINDYGQRYRDPFVGEMTGYYGAPRSLIVELLIAAAGRRPTFITPAHWPIRWVFRART